MPVSTSSLCSWPGVRRWTCGSKKAGKACRPSASISSPPSASASPGVASSAIRPPRTTTSWAPSMPATGSSTVAPRRTRSRALAGAHRRALGEAHAGCPIGVGCFGASPVGRSGLAASPAAEQLVEDRHPHHQAGGDLLGDQRLGRVDHLAGELDPAVDRAGVHQQLARAEPPRVDLEVRRVLAERGHEALRSSAPAAAAGRRRRRPPRAGRASRSTSQPSSSIPRGIRVGGPQSVTSAPIAGRRPGWSGRRGCGGRRRRSRSACPRSEPSRRRSVKTSSSAWLGCSCLPSPALITAAVGPAGDQLGGPGIGVADHDRRRVVGGEGRDCVLQRLALVDRGARCLDRDEVGGEPLRGELEGAARCGCSTRRRALTTVRPRSVGTFLMSRRPTSAKLSARSRIASISSRRAASMPAGSSCELASTAWGSEIVTSSTPSISSRRTLTRSLAGGRQVLADVIGADRQLAVAAVAEHGELDALRAGRSRRARRSRRGRCGR